MVEVEEMPYDEKFQRILGFSRLVEDFAPRLVKEELGAEKAAELRALWKKQSEPIPSKAPDQVKYEIAYKNFLQNWVTANDFMVKNKGEAGVTKFMQAAIKAWKRKYAWSAIKLKLAWIFSPKFAFRALLRKLAYQLQVFSPYTVSELDGDRMVLKVNPCKIVNTCNRFCLEACQNIIPEWLEAQFNVNMNQNRLGNDCTVKFASF